MSEDNARVPNALVAVGTKALAVRSETLIKRGLALAKSLQFLEALRELKPSKEESEHEARFLDRIGQRRKLLGDEDDAIGNYHEVIRLNPDYALAHDNLGIALGNKGDWDGAITEFRETLRLNPNSFIAHYNLDVALEHTRNPQEALQEYRTAYELNPQDPEYRNAYERLLHQRNK